MATNKRGYEIYNVESELFSCSQEYFPNCIGFHLTWEANIGFGTLSFRYDTKEHKWSYDTECMDKDFCMAVLDKWLDDLYIVNF